MLSNFIQYYKDPHLVARVQEFFGVEIHYRDNESKSSGADDERPKKRARNNGLSSPANGCLINARVQEKTKNHDESLRATTIDNNDGSENDDKPYTVKNYFWYYLFLFGTELGDEVFYTIFIPFWLWNIDGAVGRRIVLVWSIVMTIGQGLKDIICWPRPSCPPAVRLQKKWSLEYGMPSTHAMIGVSIPFSVVLFTMNRYVYHFHAGCVAAVLW